MFSVILLILLIAVGYYAQLKLVPINTASAIINAVVNFLISALPYIVAFLVVVLIVKLLFLLSKYKR